MPRYGPLNKLSEALPIVLGLPLCNIETRLQRCDRYVPFCEHR